jgi:hypothetical protein
MSEKKRSYFRIRRIAAAELVRLHAAGTLVHPDAMAWATSALDAVDDVGGRVPVVERALILDLLAKYPTTGLTVAAIAEHFGEPERRVMAMLYTLRKQGQVESVKHLGRAYYFPSKAAAAKAPPRAMRAAPSIATQAKRPVEIITPAGAKITKHPTPLVLIDRFGAADPAQRLPGGFSEEWARLRAGGAEA